MTKPLIVCVDDDLDVLNALARCLGREPSFDVLASTSPHQVLEWIGSRPVAVLISDYDMPDMTGAQLAGRAKRSRPETVRVLLTGQRSLEIAIDGINQGEIFRFLAKPCADRVLRETVREAVQRHEELLALSGDRQRRERSEALRTSLEAEYPGISTVQRDGRLIEVTADPWGEARALGLTSIAKLDQ